MMEYIHDLFSGSYFTFLEKQLQIAWCYFLGILNSEKYLVIPQDSFDSKINTIKNTSFKKAECVRLSDREFLRLELKTQRAKVNRELMGYIKRLEFLYNLEPSIIRLASRDQYNIGELQDFLISKKEAQQEIIILTQKIASLESVKTNEHIAA
ncbi:hypothetical protein ATE92_0745 [Ulvibacter sp. MAR_2010_11]|uniref:hypothetical protein n=1 Tax=Ulvibacter sp. MAR_2010_11 TaxID=1250229 RepID=UPI000C2C4D6A|nr:hypothetical protein [Ulvibacter sp. MAR_2010_11]PKA82612.1 hypothetical protein ATE92_0745 [Ulvibacter sp. MAR_2010_11]